MRRSLFGERDRGGRSALGKEVGSWLDGVKGGVGERRREGEGEGDAEGEGEGDAEGSGRGGGGDE